MPRACWGTIAVVVALLVAGCGEDERAGLSARQSRDLVERLDEARTLAAAGNVAGTEQALDGFRGRVASLRRAGALDDETARALRQGAARVLARARADTPPPEPAPVETLPAPVAPQPDEGDEGDDDDGKPGKDKGKAKGKKEKDD